MCGVRNVRCGERRGESLFCLGARGEMRFADSQPLVHFTATLLP